MRQSEPGPEGTPSGSDWHYGENYLSRGQAGRRGADGDLAGRGSRAHHGHGPALVQLRLARGGGTAVGKSRVAQGDEPSGAHHLESNRLGVVWPPVAAAAPHVPL